MSAEDLALDSTVCADGMTAAVCAKEECEWKITRKIVWRVSNVAGCTGKVYRRHDSGHYVWRKNVRGNNKGQERTKLV